MNSATTTFRLFNLRHLIFAAVMALTVMMAPAAKAHDGDIGQTLTIEPLPLAFGMVFAEYQLVPNDTMGVTIWGGFFDPDHNDYDALWGGGVTARIYFRHRAPRGAYLTVGVEATNYAFESADLDYVVEDDFTGVTLGGGYAWAPGGVYLDLQGYVSYRVPVDDPDVYYNHVWVAFKVGFGG